MRVRLTALILLAAGAAAAQTAPETAAEPPPRPADLAGGAAADAGAEAPEAPAPEARPDPEARDDSEADVEVEPGSGLRDALAETDEDFAACLAELDALGTVYETAEPILETDPDCGILRPLAVSEIVPGVALRPDARMRCETARALAVWVDRFVQPAAQLMAERGAVTGVDHGSTYICRRRNNQATGILSEHAFGNAIDVMGFRFADGSVIAVEPREREGTYAEAFQDGVRSAACLTFTTVLGPGSDAAHDDHLHLDVKARRGGFRLCQ